MGKDDPAAVEAYLAKLPRAERDALERVRAVIRRTVPGVEERIAYRMPVFSFGRDLVGFQANKNDLSLYPMSWGVTAALADEPSRFQVRGTAIHFTPDAPLPVKLIEKLVRARVRENKQRGVKQ
jgi:uncharacterized protein YdhG (YjbR/CyaY superfamily)